MAESEEDIKLDESQKSGLNEPRHSTKRTPKSASEHLKLLATQVENTKWTNKQKERQLIRERGSLLKEERELHHDTNTFHRTKKNEAREYFNELQDKIHVLSKLHHASYRTMKRSTINRIENKTKNLKRNNEEGRKQEIAITTTEHRYQTILNAMEQVVLQSEQLALQFEKQIRDKARQHHELGLQLNEVGAQLRLEKDKKDKFQKDEERRRKIDAMDKLTEWKESENNNQQLKGRLKKLEDGYYRKEQKLQKSKRIVNHDVGLKKREIGRKLQDVNCLLSSIAVEQRQLSDTKLHIANQGVIAVNEGNVQDHLSKQQNYIAQRQAKINRWEPKLAVLAQKNEHRLAELQKCVLYEELSKAGELERALYRDMKLLESDTRKQEQVCSSKKGALEKFSKNSRKEAQGSLRKNAAEYNELEVVVKAEESTLKQLVAKRDNTLADYRQHQAKLKEMIQLFNTLSSEQNRKQLIKPTF